MNDSAVGKFSTTAKSPRKLRAIRYIALGAVVGAGIGAACSAALLVMSRDGGESREGAVLIAHVLAVPLTIYFQWIDWGHWASQWVAFIIIAIPLNGLVLGAVTGAIGGVLSAPKWTIPSALLVAWAGIVAFVMARVR